LSIFDLPKDKTFRDNDDEVKEDLICSSDSETYTNIMKSEEKKLQTNLLEICNTG